MLMAIAKSVAKDAPPSQTRSEILMELAQTVAEEVPPSATRASVLMQLFVAAETVDDSAGGSEVDSR